MEDPSIRRSRKSLTDISSLKRFDRLADRIRQHRQADSSAILIVEGPSDSATLRRLLPGVSIFPASGRNNALGESSQVHDWNFDRWACVVDRDFDDVLTGYSFGIRLHPYDGADLEAMLVSLGVLGDMVEHFGSEAKIAREGGIEEVVELLCGAVAGVANLRRRNATSGWGLPFDAVAIEEKIDRSNLQLNVRGYCTALRAGVADTVSLQELIDTANDDPLDSGTRFGGKDAVAVLAVALRKRIGSLTKEQVSMKVLLPALRASGTWRLGRSEWLSVLEHALDS